MSKNIKYDVHSIGRRKTSVARVYMVKGQGKVSINGRSLKDYFPLGTQQYVATQPLGLLKVSDQYDLLVNVCGGGTTGQAGAIRLGVARALAKMMPQSSKDLRDAGFLTRDARKVERKKYGLAGARRSFQFSKR